uniref:Cytochrome P450 n=1 Tax=Kalanchoe fedtschenkoi TaxID=63787 RepID=A0A7N0VLC8_KALFE
MLPLTLLVLLLAGLALLWGLTKKRRRHNFMIHKQPPSPPGLPIIGNLHQLGARPHQSLTRFAERHGPVMLLRLGFEPTLVLSSAEAAKEALKTRDVDYSSRALSFCWGKLTYNYVDVAFTSYSEYWREKRKICVVELVNLKRVQSFQPVRTEVTDALIQSLAASAAKGEAVDLGEVSFELTASIIFKIAFGRSLKGSLMDGKGLEKLLHETTAVLGSFAAADFFPYVGWMADKLSGLHSRLDRLFERFDGFLEGVIQEHLNSDKLKDKQHEDIVDVLLRIHREHVRSGATWFTMNNVKAILIDVFLGGIDTGAITLVWALAELVKNPEVMKKVQDEIRHWTSGKDRLTEKDIDNLKYFKMVIKETLRLHTAVPLLVSKKTTAKTQMFGYPIQEGVRVFINVWAIARDPKVWDQPEKFIPERFKDSLVDYRGQHFELLPFGGCRRICPEINMAMATIEFVLANMLHRFDWKLSDGMTPEELDLEEGRGFTVFRKSLSSLCLSIIIVDLELHVHPCINHIEPE